MPVPSTPVSASTADVNEAHGFPSPLPVQAMLTSVFGAGWSGTHRSTVDRLIED